MNAISVSIPNRFRGPQTSGNGGYTCGLVAQAIDGPAEVTLRQPPPLDVPLQRVKEGEEARLLHGEEVIAVAVGTDVDITPPSAPSWETAQEAEKRFVAESHRYPECFVCGPDRSEGDGLRLFPGPDDAGDLAVSTWVPPTDFADAEGRVRPEIVWAVLDCPGYFGLMDEGLLALLGRMSARIDRLPEVGERCVVAGWRIGQERRKYFAGSALFGEDRSCLARAAQTWIRVG